MSAIDNSHVVSERVAATPMDLLRHAIERGCDAEQLDKLVGMMERLERNRAEIAFNAAMNAAQKEMPIVIRDANNPHTKSRFARLEAVQAVVKPIYTHYGFGLSFSEQHAEREGHIRIECEVGHVGGCTRRYWIEVPPDGTGAKGGATAMSAVQGIGSSFSYACRYLTIRIFNVAIADEDADGNAPGGRINAEQIKIINEKIDECRAAGNPVDFAAFLKWLKVEILDDLPQNKFPVVVEWLSKKRRQKSPANKGDK